MGGPGHIHETRQIRRLIDLDNFFLEALVPAFELTRRAGGCHVSLEFDDDSLAIWGNGGKMELLRMIPDFDKRASEIQSKIEAVIHRGKRRVYRHDDPAFPFRYANGGALPIIRYRGADYYCLFYRDVFPVGWNIANGGSDSRYEMLAPEFTIERELREELIALDLKRHAWYVFQAYPQWPIDMPEFRLARQFWQQHFPGHDLEGFDKNPVPMQWLNGPDTLRVRDRNSLQNTVSEVFLNINATDFGIEIDRVAQLALSDDAIILDGEVNRFAIVDRVIGLFRVESIERQLRKGKGKREHDLIPDFIFHSGKRHEKERLGQPKMRELLGRRITRYIRRLEKLGLRTKGAARSWEQLSRPQKYAYCPVTKGILLRYHGLPASGSAPQVDRPRVFVSYGGEDERIARVVYRYLEKEGCDAFFAPERQGPPSFINAINDALEESRLFLAVGTSARDLNRHAPTYERGRFNTLMLNDSRRSALSFISFDPKRLPAPLDQSQAVRFRPGKARSRLRDLLRFIPERD